MTWVWTGLASTPYAPKATGRIRRTSVPVVDRYRRTRAPHRAAFYASCLHRFWFSLAAAVLHLLRLLSCCARRALVSLALRAVGGPNKQRHGDRHLDIWAVAVSYGLDIRAGRCQPRPSRVLSTAARGAGRPHGAPTSPSFCAFWFLLQRLA